jgi:hypothetical protein
LYIILSSPTLPGKAILNIPSSLSVAVEGPHDPQLPSRRAFQKELRRPLEATPPGKATDNIPFKFTITVALASVLLLTFTIVVLASEPHPLMFKFTTFTTFFFDFYDGYSSSSVRYR